VGFYAITLVGIGSHKNPYFRPRESISLIPHYPTNKPHKANKPHNTTTTPQQHLHWKWGYLPLHPAKNTTTPQAKNEGE